MKKIISIAILTLVVVGGLVFSFTALNNDLVAHRDIKTEAPKKSMPIILSAAEKQAELKKWQASPDGIMFKNWEASPAGKKVSAAIAKLSKSVNDFTAMEAVVTNLLLPPGSRLGYAVMVQIEGEEYILSFGIEQPGKNSLNFKSEFDQLRTLKVNDNISIRSHNLSKAPKYAYPILAGDEVERAGELIYKRTPRKDGC